MASVPEFQGCTAPTPTIHTHTHTREQTQYKQGSLSGADEGSLLCDSAAWAGRQSPHLRQRSANPAAPLKVHFYLLFFPPFMIFSLLWTRLVTERCGPLSNVQRGLTCRDSAFVNPVGKDPRSRQLCLQTCDPGTAEAGALRWNRPGLLSNTDSRRYGIAVRELPAANRDTGG